MSHDLVALLSIGRAFRTVFWLGHSLSHGLKAAAASLSDSRELCRPRP